MKVNYIFLNYNPCWNYQCLINSTILEKSSNVFTWQLLVVTTYSTVVTILNPMTLMSHGSYNVLFPLWSNARYFLWDNFVVTAIILILKFPFAVILNGAATENGRCWRWSVWGNARCAFRTQSDIRPGEFYLNSQWISAVHHFTISSMFDVWMSSEYASKRYFFYIC